MRVLRSGDYTRMPWKNGGGETIEILASPERASLDTFDWRISMAHVGTPGLFSEFPGIDRTLSVIAGAGLSLTFDEKTVALDRTSQPFRFRGDARVDSVLRDGAIDDLNVMTRRERCEHCVTRHALAAPKTLVWQGDVAVIVAIGGGVDVRSGDETVMLAATDAVVLGAGDARNVVVTPKGDVDVFLVDLLYV